MICHKIKRNLSKYYFMGLENATYIWLKTMWEAYLVVYHLAAIEICSFFNDKIVSRHYKSVNT